MNSSGRSPAVRRMGRVPAVLGMLVALLIVAGLLLANTLRAPYVILRPGHAYDVLSGQGPANSPMLAVAGHETFPTAGELNMTTVAVYGGPGHEVTWWDVARSKVGGVDRIIDREVVYPTDVTAEEVEQQTTGQMLGSQDAATLVALRAAGIEVTEQVQVAGVLPQGPAQGVVEEQDVILTVAGEAVQSITEVQAAVRAVPAGDPVSITVRRGGEREELRVPTEQVQGNTIIGVTLQSSPQSEVEVEFAAGDVGGPSAGLMLALGIYDKLTPGELTGGENIAGSGTISPDGQVGPVDGVPQKMVGAREAGATIFLAPDATCEGVIGNEPGGMDVFAVTDFAEALEAVEQIAQGETAALDTCEKLLAS